MITPIKKNYKGIILITGPTRSGKSQLAEFLIQEHESVTYIATSEPRQNDPEWERRIEFHRSRRPIAWKLIEHPKDICRAIELIRGNESILIDSLGGLVNHHLIKDDDQWENFQNKFLKSITENNLCILVVAEEVGWGVVPSTRVGHLFRERLSTLNSLVSMHSKKRWLAVNGYAIDLDKAGDQIP